MKGQQFMNSYFSTFIAGTGEIVKADLLERLPETKVILLFDGLIAYETPSEIEKITSLPFFNNSFLLLKTFENLTQDPIEGMLRKVLKDKRLQEKIRSLRKPGPTFRIMASKENQTVAMNANLLRNLENLLAQQNNLRVNRSQPDFEFWFLYRREGYGFFARRLTSHTAYEKILEKGELRPELAYLLCRVSEPQSTDIFLDPFCGSGAIPLQRCSFPYDRIVASDNDVSKIKKLKARARKTDLQIQTMDAFSLSSHYKNKIHKIATDPPWGFFSQIEREPVDFYKLMLEECHKVLVEKGILVLLIGPKEVFEKALEEFPGKFHLRQKYDILVSGKKAAIYKLDKN